MNDLFDEKKYHLFGSKYDKKGQKYHLRGHIFHQKSHPKGFGGHNEH